LLVIVQYLNHHAMQIGVVIVEPGPDVKVTQSSQCSDEETHFEEVINVLRNLRRGGMQPMSIAYTSTDCLITMSTDRGDWLDYVDTRDPNTGEWPQSAERLLAEKAIGMGLGTSIESTEDLGQKAIQAGVVLVPRGGGRRVALTKAEVSEEKQT
jgi:hypothetical protein